jgi:predicted metal-dependent phosphoesterase TrpH
VEITYEAVEQAAHGSAVGRPHIADVLVEHGVVRQFDEAFREYIGNHCPAYVPKSRLSPNAAIELVHRAGGVAVLAHPYIADMVRFIDTLIPLGLDGLEAYHYSQDRQQRRQLKRLAARHGLIVTGGSDFHGRSDREGQVGAEHVPAELLDALKQRQLLIRGMQ